MKPANRIRNAVLSLAALAALTLAACSGGSTTAASAAMPTRALSGTVHGGQSPISSAPVSLFAVGAGANPAVQIANGFTDANGNFTLGSYTCPSATTQVYLVASDGNPGLSGNPNNTAIKLMAALGGCAAAPATVNVNELTTVAAAYALNGFIDGGGVHGSDPGLTNAMNTAALLADASTGNDGPDVNFTATQCSGGSAPVNCHAETTLNALANALAACVNTGGGSSSQCVELFACALPGAAYSAGACTGGTGTAPTDTLQAVLSIARHPGLVSLSGMNDVATRNVVFSPVPSVGQPLKDWALVLNHTGGVFAGDPIAIDAAGNIWVGNTGGGPNGSTSVSEFDPTGVPAPGSPFTGGGLSTQNSDFVFGLAIDPSGNVWAPTWGTGQITKLDANGNALGTFDSLDNGKEPKAIAIDAAGNAWVANQGQNGTVSEFTSAGSLIGAFGAEGGDKYGVAVDATPHIWSVDISKNNVVELDASGAAVTGSPFNGGGSVTAPNNVAIAPNGNIWITNTDGTTLTELSGTDGSTISPAGGFTPLVLTVDNRETLGLAIDAAGNVWLSRKDTLAIAEVDSNGQPLTQQGLTGNTGDGDGNASGLDIAVDPSGNVWVVNRTNGAEGLDEFIGAAAPTRTPLVDAIRLGFTPGPPT